MKDKPRDKISFVVDDFQHINVNMHIVIQVSTRYHKKLQCLPSVYCVYGLCLCFFSNIPKVIHHKLIYFLIAAPRNVSPTHQSKH